MLLKPQRARFQQNSTLCFIRKEMYFWKVDDLLNDLKSDKVTQKEEFKYLLIFFVFAVLSTDPVLYANTSYNIYNSISSIIFILITILGLYYCYKINASGDDKDFIKRILCISLPVMVRLFVIFTPISLLVGLSIYYVIQGNTMSGPIPEVHEQNIYEVVYMGLLESVYFIYLANKISTISRT